jgi:hypothetical protein
MSPRKRFYMAQVSFSGVESAALVYLNTPYGQKASERVLTAIEESIDEGADTLHRIRPLIPPAGEELPDANARYVNAGLDTLDSVIERLNRTVFSESAYREVE